MRRIRLIADDYALAPGVSRAIRELLAWGRLTGTSVMTPAPDLAEEAQRLLAVRGPRRVQIGLHATLTGGLVPLAGGRFRSLPALMAAAFGRVLDGRAVGAELAAQFTAFETAFGRAPDFVDGHQHVHLLPGVREVLLDLVAARAPGAWVRQCAPAGAPPAPLADPKGALLARLSRGLVTLAAARSIATNPAFAGAYLFRRHGEFPILFKGFLQGLPDGGVVMCHPGHLDAELAARDPMTAPRASEFAFLAGPGLPTTLAAAGAELV